MDVDTPAGGAGGATAGGGQETKYSIGTSALVYRKDYMEVFISKHLKFINLVQGNLLHRTIFDLY